MKKLLGLTLGILTATGGFIDAGALATSAAAGANFGLGLVWAMLLATVCVILLVEMSGRLAAVSGQDLRRRDPRAVRLPLLPRAADQANWSPTRLLLAADLGGMAVALSLFTGWSWHLLLPVAALIVFGFVWRAPFAIIENLPSLLGLVTLTFWAAAFAGPNHIDEPLLATLTRPTLRDERDGRLPVPGGRHPGRSHQSVPDVLLLVGRRARSAGRGARSARTAPPRCSA